MRRVSRVTICGFLVAISLFVAWVPYAWLWSLRECNKRAECAYDLKLLHSAVKGYWLDHNARLPEGNSCEEVFRELIEAGYLSREAGPIYGLPPYVCPGARSDIEAWRDTRALTPRTCSYEIVDGVDFNSPPDFVLAFDRSPGNHLEVTICSIARQRNVLLVGGYMPIVCSEDKFQRRIAWQQEMTKRMKEGEDYIPFHAWEGVGR